MASLEFSLMGSAAQLNLAGGNFKSGEATPFLKNRLSGSDIEITREKRSDCQRICYHYILKRSCCPRCARLWDNTWLVTRKSFLVTAHFYRPVRTDDPAQASRRTRPIHFVAMQDSGPKLVHPLTRIHPRRAPGLPVRCHTRTHLSRWLCRT